MKTISRIIAASAVLLSFGTAISAQRYPGVIDKSIAVVGNEMISLGNLESEIQTRRAQGMYSDRNMRCEILEQMMEGKLFLMQARLDSLTVNEAFSLR